MAKQNKDAWRPTLDDVRRWLATVNVAKAASAFRISRSHAYELITTGNFPARVIKLRTSYRVVTASIIRGLSGGGV